MESATADARPSAPRGHWTPRRCARRSRSRPRTTPTVRRIRTKDDEFSLHLGRVRRAGRERWPRGLAALGVSRGDTVAIMLTNRPEFHFFDAAAMHLGATPFSIYNTYTAEQIEYLVERRRQHGRRHRAGLPRHDHDGAQDAVDRLEHVIVVDGDGPTARLTLDELEAGRRRRLRLRGRLEGRRARRHAHADLHLGHHRPAQGRADHARQHDRPPCAPSTRSSSSPTAGASSPTCPMAHIAERSVQPLPADGARLHDHRLPGPAPGRGRTCPRCGRRGSSPCRASGRSSRPASRPGSSTSRTQQKKQAMQGALELGLKKVRARAGRRGGPRGARSSSSQQADEQVFSQRSASSSASTRSRRCNVGAAPTPPEVIEFFHAIGVPLAELWGMSETCGAGTCNPPDKIKIGTVGPPAPGVEIKLAEDGEVLIKGAVVMNGYRNLPDKTEETFDRRRLAAHRRHRRVRRRRLPEDRRPQEGADHQRGRQEHVAGQHRGARSSPSSPLIGQAVAIGDAPALQRRADHARPRRRAGLRRAERASRTPRSRRSPRTRRSSRRSSTAIDAGQRAAGPRGADQEVQDPADRLGARRRRADADDEAQAQADRREVRGRDRGAVRQ